MRINAHLHTTMTLGRFNTILLEDLLVVRVEIQVLYFQMLPPTEYYILPFIRIYIYSVDMYAGAGGMSIGLNKHFDVKWVSFGD